MSAPIQRLFVDVSYTRTQTGSIGVTRTVRRLLEEFQQATSRTGLECHPVAVHRRGFRQVALQSFAELAASPSRAHSGTVTKMLRWATGGRVRRLALAYLPPTLLHVAWGHYSRWTFDALSRRAPPVGFRPGDVLFMGDAAWHYDASHAIEQARHQGCRVVLMVYDLIPLRQPEYCAPLVSLVFGGWLEQMLRCADAVICISQATERDLMDYAASAGWPLPPTGHFRLGCDPARQAGEPIVRPGIAHFLSQPGASFAAVGSFEPRKNYAWLLQVFERLWANGHSVRLLIAGRPTADGQALIDKMKQHPEQGHRLMTVLDASDQELDHVYAHARALLFPSLAEGFGLPLVEARARGCRVIASDLPAFLELGDRDVSFFPQNSKEALTKLVIEFASQNQSKPVAPMRAFTWQESAEQFLTTASMLLNEAQPAGKL